MLLDPRNPLLEIFDAVAQGAIRAEIVTQIVDDRLDLNALEDREPRVRLVDALGQPKSKCQAKGPSSILNDLPGAEVSRARVSITIVRATKATAILPWRLIADRCLTQLMLRFWS